MHWAHDKSDMYFVAMPNSLLNVGDYRDFNPAALSSCLILHAFTYFYVTSVLMCSPSGHRRSWTSAPSCDTWCSSSPRQWPEGCRDAQPRCLHSHCCPRCAGPPRHSGSHNYREQHRHHGSLSYSATIATVSPQIQNVNSNDSCRIYNV